MFFIFYTTPQLKIFMPREESKEVYLASYFFRIQEVISTDGFHTSDLG